MNHNNATFSKSWFLKRKPVLILYGTETLQYEFLKHNVPKFSQMGLQLIVQDVHDEGPVKAILQTHKPRLLVLTDGYRSSLTNDLLIPKTHTSLPQHVKIGFFQKAIMAYFYYFRRVEEPVYQDRLKQLSNETIRQNTLKYFLRSRKDATRYELTSEERLVISQFVSYNHMDESEPVYSRGYDNMLFHLRKLSENPLKAPPAKCPKISCPPGFYRTYSNTTFGYEWMCEPCPVNHFKTNDGNDTQCKRCSGVLSIDNGKRTGCVDPYTEIKKNLKTPEQIFVLSLSGSGLIATLITMLTFIRKRKTPIVSLSDYAVSMVHMALICFIFITILLSLTIGFLNTNICLTKVLSISVCYVTSVGIVFIKSQKLLQAFLSNVRLTASEAKRTVGVQVFIVVLFLLFVNGLLFIVIFRSPVEVLELRHLQTLSKQFVCNTYYHITFVVAVTMIIQLLCSIQAFRGRNLPNLMNDGIVLTYATFALSVVFGVSFAIVHFQKIKDKEAFQLAAIAANNFIISFLLYGQKAIRMFVYPEKNTKSYFQMQRMVGAGLNK